MVQSAPAYASSNNNYQSEARKFYSLDWGQNSTRIAKTEGSLLTLPTLTKNVEHQLVACSGPKDRSMASFWKDLVLAQGATLIVNLCGSVGNTGDWWADECSQYWPLSMNEPVSDTQNTVQVSLLQCEELCETLKSSKLHVRQIDSRGNTV